MMETNMDAKESIKQDRRKEKRYLMRGDTFAFLRPPVNKIGQLIDISMTGLAFSYFSTNGASYESNGLDLLGDEGIYLEDIPYRTVSDFILPNEQPFSQITMRRRCIEFGELTDEHIDNLRALIVKYGLKETKELTN
ncbi:MAG: hypothetical protein KQH63_14020 [Desulfobulbaceae bacterium]|nr:hypothetical protein [Desulfobulbaceae bacterium]